MTFKKIIPAFVIAYFSIFSIISQEIQHTVIAKSGDGIFSLLRNEGIEVAKYYEEFIELNEANIKNGSHLIVGKEYKIPFAPDSFKNTGVRIQFPNNQDEAIFKYELASLKRIDSTMRNTVYYFITDASNENIEEIDIVEKMARKLIQRKAKVYLLNYSGKDDSNLLDLTTIINKKYLMHSGHYQRVLVFKNNGDVKNAQTNITLYHNANSKDGRKMVDNLLLTLGENKIKQKSLNDYAGVFNDFKRVSFAKNLLPTLTFVEIGEKGKSEVKSVKISSNKKNIADMITGGILRDYSKLEFEDK